MLNTVITNQANKHSAEIDSTDGEVQALVTATRPLKTFTNSIQFFTSDVGSVDMNVNGAASGTSVTLYDEDVEWTTTNIVSNRFDFGDAGPAGGAHSGSVCIDATATRNNDVMELDNGSDVDLSVYSFLTGWIYVTGWVGTGTKEVLVTGYDGAAPVGNSVDLGGYVNTSVTGWQNFVIPLSAMALVGQTITALRITTVDIGSGPPPNYYLDLIQFVQPTGDGQQVYTVEPTVGTWLYIDTIHSIMAAPDSANVDGSSNMIPYNSLLGVIPSVGVLYQNIRDEEPSFTLVLKGISDLLQVAGTSVSYGGDGTNTWLTLSFKLTTPIVLNWKTSDSMKILINDDLSSLLLYRASISGWTESRPVHD